MRTAGIKDDLEIVARALPFLKHNVWCWSQVVLEWRPTIHRKYPDTAGWQNDSSNTVEWNPHNVCDRHQSNCHSPWRWARISKRRQIPIWTWTIEQKSRRWWSGNYVSIVWILALMVRDWERLCNMKIYLVELRRIFYNIL